MVAKSKVKVAAVDDEILSYLMIGSGVVLVLIGLFGLAIRRRYDMKSRKTQELARANALQSGSPDDFGL
ncbi:nitrate reductase gamma subunit [Bradyrhizobium sp. USDA 3311]